MNLGAGQPVSLPYGVEPPLWYSNQYPYHSVQFSLSPQQWGLPFSSPIYHPPPPDYQPPPPGYHPPPLPNHYSPYAYHFSQPNYPPPQLTQPNSYPPPQNNHSATLINGHWLPLQFPCVSQAHTQDYPCPHLQPTHTIPPHTTYEPPPPIAPGSQLCSLPLQLGGVSESEVSIVDSGRPSLNYPDAKLSEFIESMSKSFDTCISKCIERLQLFEGFSPTHKPKFQSSAPKISSPQLPQPTSKLSPLLDDAQSVNLLMPSLSTSRNKRVTLKSTAATGGVKKRRLFRPGTIVPRETGKYQRRNKPPFKSSVVPSTLENTVLAHWISSTVWAQSNNTPASSCSVSDTGTSNSDFNFVSIDCDSVDSMLFAKLNENENLENVEEGIFDKRIMVNNGDDYELGELKGIGVQQENQGPKSFVKGRESQTLHLFDEMSKSKELCNAGKMSVGYMGIRDKGGGLTTHCAIVYEYFQLPDKKTTAHLDYKPSVVSRNFGLKDKTARALAPSEALTGVHGFMEFGDCKLDYFGKGVLAVAGNVNDIIGPALIENDPVEQILVDNYMVQQLERFRNEWGWCKQELGENAISAVSLYVRKAGANLAGNKTLILHVPTKSDGSSITLLTKDICNNVWVSSGAVKLVQSEFRTPFVLVMNKPTDIVDDNYENIQAHSKRVLELLLKKWKSRVIAKTQSQARLVQWFILSLQLCHCKRKVPTLACTLNACSNGNMLCLRLEINLEKMSLCLAEKWEKRDRIVKQMFDGNWERWKFIVIAIKNESGTEELHVESLLAVLGVWERIFSRREDKEVTIVDQNYSCASCFQERDCFVVLKLVLLALLKPLQLQSWPTTEDKLKQGGISDKFCEGLKLLWLLFFSDVMSILLLFNKGVIASGMSTKILCECLESLFDVLDKFGNVMATYHKLSLGALLSQWSSNQVIMRKKTKSCAASLASRLSDDLLAKAAIEVVQHFSNSDSSSFTSSPDGFGVCFEDFNAKLWFLSLLATMQSTVQFPKYSKIIWSLDTLAYSNGSNFASSIVRDQGVGVAILMNSKTILVAFFGKVIPGSSYVLLLALVDGKVRLWVLERDHAFFGWHSTKDIKHDSYSMILSVLAKYVESLNSTSIAASSYVCGKLISKAARWDMIADEVSHPEVLLVIGKYKSRMDGICGEHGFLHDKKWGGIVTEHGSLLRCLNLYKLPSWEANGTCKEIMQGDYGTLKFRFEIINLLTVKFITYVTIVADSCIAESAEDPHIKEVISIAFELQFELIIISAKVGYEFSKLFLESAYSEMRGTRQVIRDVTKDLKTENTDALCKDSQGLSLPPSATDSYFYGKLNAKGESSEVIFISLGMEEEAFEQDFKNMDLIICDCLYVSYLKLEVKFA